MRTNRIALIGGASLLLVAGVLAGMLWPRAAQAQGQSATPLTTLSSDSQESSFGDLAADALRTAGNAQIALVAAISFRTNTMPPGPLGPKRVGMMLANPDETWAVSKLTGAQLRAALEHSVRTAPLPNSAFLQVSGLTLSYSQSGDRGGRVRSVSAGGAPLNDAATYTVAMPLSLAKGGSGYFKFFTKEAVITESPSSVAAAIIDFGQRQGSVSYTGTGRIAATP
jgi:2',3'-cyclic-nucleotide 2'-phosphodiesterase (5'-nucleotidase family)